MKASCLSANYLLLILITFFVLPKYLHSVKPLLSDEEYKKMEELTMEFKVCEALLVVFG